MTEDFQALSDIIRAERRYGIVTCHIEQRIATAASAQKEELRAFLRRLGFSPPHPWRDIRRGRAMAIAQLILAQDLAYHITIMSLDRAAELTQRFVQLFPKPSNYRTNALFETRPESRPDQPSIRLSSWTPLTASTIDTGILCISSQHIGILWVQDED